jgi:hypothetical protein
LLYIDRPCSSGWIEGKKLNMEGQCKPNATSCHPFKSDNKTAGAWQFNFTETLGPNEYCKIEVDATAYIARVVLDDSVTLGALSGSKVIKVGEIFEVPKGQTKTILAYNGDTSGSITFTLAEVSAGIVTLCKIPKTSLLPNGENVERTLKEIEEIKSQYMINLEEKHLQPRAEVTFYYD